MKRFLIIFLTVFSLIVLSVLLKFLFDKKLFLSNHSKTEAITLVNKTETQITNKEPVIFEDDVCENIFELVISNKKFLCFFPNSCYDKKTFVYDKLTDTYYVDFMYEQDPAGDLEYPPSKCPYDSGYITHLIFNITFSPSKNIFTADYKGFISSIDISNTKSEDSFNKFLNIYYDNNPNFIYGLIYNIEYFKNKKITSDPIFINTFTNELKCLYNRIKS